MSVLKFADINSHKAGLFGLYLFAFFAFLDKAGTVLGLLLMLSAMLVSWRQVWEDYKQDPAVWIAGIFLIYLIVHAYITSLEFPHTSEEQWKEARNWGRLIVFLILAWWMRGNTRVIFHCLLLVLTGTCVRLVLDTDTSDIESALHAGRTGFAYPIHFAGMLSGASLIAMLIFSPRVAKYPAQPGIRVVILLLWVAVIVMMLQIHITASSRSAWLATIIILIASLFFLYKSVSKNLLIYGIIAILFILITVPNIDVLEKGTSRDEKTISLFLEGASMDEIPIKGSAGIRLHLWHYGIKRWLERPLTGWGPGTEITKHFRAADFEDQLDRRQSKNLARYPHLHNAYINVLAQIGIIGAIILGIALILIIRQLLRAHRQQLLPNDLIVAAASVITVMLVANLTQSRFATLDFQYLATLTAAVAYTSRYRKPDTKPDDPQTNSTRLI